MYLTSYAGITLPNRMLVQKIGVTQSVGRFAVTGALRGEYITGTTYQAQKYTFEGIFLRDTVPMLSTVDNVLDGLRGATGINDLVVLMRDGTSRVTQAVLTEFEIETSNASFSSLAQKVSGSFEADPYWYSETEYSEDLGGFDKIVCLNRGNATSMKLKIDITSAVNSLLTIGNAANGEQIEVDITKSAGSHLIIDNFASDVTLDGNSVYGSTYRADTQIALLSLAKGVNGIQFSSPVTGTITYRSCWY